MQRNSTPRPYLLLQVMILMFAFSGILGKYIQTPATAITVYRTAITFVVLGAYMYWKGMRFGVGAKDTVLLLLSGGVVGMQWALAFMAIKQANVSVAMTMLATGALFASFLEPIFYHRRLRIHEVLLGAVAIGGIYIIYSTQSNADFRSGILIALGSSFLSACYSIINGKWAAKMPDRSVTVIFYEMIGAVVVVSLVFSAVETGFAAGFAQVRWQDAAGIFILAVACTAYTNVSMVRILRYVSPFTLMLNMNLLPVYSMVLAVVIYPDTESMPLVFYIGAAVIISTVLLNTVLNDRRQKRPDGLKDDTPSV